MKVVLVGPDSVHIQRFYDNMKSRDIDFQMIAETDISWFEGQQFNYSFRSNNPLVLWRNYMAVRKIIRREKPDLVHIHQINRLAVIIGAAAKNEGIKVIATAWGSDVLLVPKRGKFYASLTKSALKKADLITADAEVMIESMRELHPNGVYRIWQYGIDPIEADVEKEKIIYSNRMHEPLYRIDRVINYFADFHLANPDWKLVIGGNGSLTDQLKKQVDELKLNHAVDFAGYCGPKVNAAFYVMAPLYISIPNSDGTSVSLMEAMSAGCIPIVSNLDVNRVWIDHNVNGIVENSAENPLIAALKLDFEKVESINKDLTNAISRSKMGDEMMGFYRDLVKI